MKSYSLLRGLKRTRSVSNYVKTSIRQKYSSAFDPFYALHTKNMTREQQQAFREVWDEDKGGFKRQLTEKERELFQTKVNATDSIDEFEGLLKGLWGPDRHAYIRKTLTFRYTKDTVYKFISTSSNSHQSALSLIFGNDDEFNTFLSTSKLKLNDINGLLSEFTFADLRYMCACIGIDYLGGPEITMVFGNRNKYHFKYPDPKESSAYWMDCIYDRVNIFSRVYVSGIQALKLKQPISQQYFRDLLDGLEPNAYKEEEWRDTAQHALNSSEALFDDNFDRAFNEFQTDAGVTKLKTVFPTDWSRFKNTNNQGINTDDIWTWYKGDIDEYDEKAGNLVERRNKSRPSSKLPNFNHYDMPQGNN